MKNNYYPCMLGNGVDAMYIGWSGSMLISEKKPQRGVEKCWYKIDRREKMWGAMVPMAASYTTVTVAGEEYRARKSVQRLDTTRGILSTKAEALGLKYEATTFLTKDHVLVEHYKIVRVPAGEKKAGLDSRIIDGGLDSVLVATKMRRRYSRGGNYTQFNYGFEGIKGCMRIFTDSGKIKFHDSSFISVEGLKEGDEVTKYTVHIDNKDAGDYMEAVNKATAYCLKRGYAGVLKNHAAEWKRYASMSSVRIPDREMQRSYYTGLYVLKCLQHPVSGCVSAGLFPSQWEGCIAVWDTYFYHRGLLQTNHIREAEKQALFWAGLKDESEKIVKKIFNVKGVSFNGLGTVTHDGKVKSLSKDDHQYDNGVVLIELFNQYAYTGDAGVLEKLYPVIKGLADFIINELVIEKKGYAVIRPVVGIDESIKCKYENDTWTAAASIKGLEDFIEASRVLNRKIDGRYKKILSKLEKGFRRNWKKGVLLSFPGAERPGIAGPNTFMIMPERDAGPTINESLKGAGPGKGVGQDYTPRDNARVYPWTNLNLTGVMAARGDSRTYPFIRQVMGCRNSFGAFTESVGPDGSNHVEWFSTVHGAYLTAVCNMLVSSLNDEISLFPAIPRAWKNVEFKNLLVQPGIRVSCKMKRGRIRKLKVENVTARRLSVKINAPGENGRRKENILLQPGETLLLR